MDFINFVIGSSILSVISLVFPFLQTFNQQLLSDVITYIIDISIWMDKHHNISKIFEWTKIAMFPMSLAWFISASCIGTLHHKFRNISWNEWFGCHLYKQSFKEMLFECFFKWIAMTIACIVDYVKNNVFEALFIQWTSYTMNQYKNGKILSEVIRYGHYKKMFYSDRYHTLVQCISVNEVVEVILEYLDESDDHSIVLRTYDIDMKLVDNDIFRYFHKSSA